MAKTKSSNSEPGKPEVGNLAIRWRRDVAEHDYGAAEAYLSMKLGTDRASEVIAQLRAGEITRRRANDILRAAGLEAAPLDDPGVIKDVLKIIEGKALSPVLVVGGDGRADIADGFHRVSLVYRIDPYGQVPLRLANASR